MLTILFWNMQRSRAAASLAARACVQHAVDLLIVAECVDAAELAYTLGSPPSPYASRAYAPSNVHVFHSAERSTAKPVHASQRANAVLFEGATGPAILVVGVHLRCKLHASAADQDGPASIVANAIVAAEERYAVERTIVVGDFNMDPFETPMVRADRFHAVMDRTIARQGTRIVAGRRYKYFYNPLWGRFGDETPGPSGTYRSNKRGLDAIHWHSFDQVLLRPALIDAYDRGRLEVLDSIAGTPLRRTHSDHSPLLVSFA